MSISFVRVYTSRRTYIYIYINMSYLQAHQQECPIAAMVVSDVNVWLTALNSVIRLIPQTDVHIVIRFVLYAPGVQRLQPPLQLIFVPVMRMHAMAELDREGWDVCLCSISHRLFLFLWCSSVRNRRLALTLNPFLLCRMPFRYLSSTSCLTYTAFRSGGFTRVYMVG